MGLSENIFEITLWSEVDLSGWNDRLCLCLSLSLSLSVSVIEKLSEIDMNSGMGQNLNLRMHRWKDGFCLKSSVFGGSSIAISGWWFSHIFHFRRNDCVALECVISLLHCDVPSLFAIFWGQLYTVFDFFGRISETSHVSIRKNQGCYLGDPELELVWYTGLATYKLKIALL